APEADAATAPPTPGRADRPAPAGVRWRCSGATCPLTAADRPTPEADAATAPPAPGRADRPAPAGGRRAPLRLYLVP
ncbi:MAG TPA: hypothetical protein VKB57_14410, partial [Acidimicrobiales bacterium]|nr:hypothetical protein [Acidimicrobiales bacterium]